MGIPRAFKFGTEIGRQAYKPKKMQKQVTWPIFKILGPLHISGMGAARDFKFGVPIDRQA